MTRTRKIKLMEAIHRLQGDEVPAREYLEANLDLLHQQGREAGISISQHLMAEYHKLVEATGSRGGFEWERATKKSKAKAEAKTNDSLVVKIG